MSDKRLVIITGLSGSGKSTAARALEDEGYFVVDNLPLVMLPGFLDLSSRAGNTTPRIAVVMDARNRDFLSGGAEILSNLSSGSYELEVLFFEATDEELIRRFSETRRRPPLSGKQGVAVAIRKERELISRFRPLATAFFDSTGLNVHQLRRKVLQYLEGDNSQSASMDVQIQSFGYRYGLPLESDLVIDVRFLPNPHFISELRPLTGLDKDVREYVVSQKPCKEFLDRFQTLLNFLIPQYQGEGKSCLTISVGCTGGRHRSVSIVEYLSSWFAFERVSLGISHRDILKERS